MADTLPGDTLDLTKDDSDGINCDVDMKEDAELQSLETELHQVCIHHPDPQIDSLYETGAPATYRKVN